MRLAIRVAREQGDELARETGGRKVSGHHAEQPILRADEGGDARRHRRLAGRQVRVRSGECVDELVEIEQVAHLRLGENEHQDSRLSNPSACWFHGTRCVTPVAARPRFARYQS